MALPAAFEGFFERRRGAISAGERSLIDKLLRSVTADFKTKKYVLGLCIDFALLAQTLKAHEPALVNYDESRSDDWLFERFERRTHSGEKELNSLTLAVDGGNYGIRKYEELVREYFHGEGYMSYPSAYVYNTGQWGKFRHYLADVFRLSSAGRYALIEALIDHTKGRLAQSAVQVSHAEFNVTLAQILREYPLSAPDENAGLAYQAISYGVARVMFPDLIVTAASVRTGSRRQGRLGDIDGWEGARLAATIEVKDLSITPANAEKQIGQFAGDTAQLGIPALVFCRAAENAVKGTHPHLTFVDDDFLRIISRCWDASNYRQFFSSVLFFLAHIECNEKARARFESYLEERRNA